MGITKEDQAGPMETWENDSLGASVHIFIDMVKVKYSTLETELTIDEFACELKSNILEYVQRKASEVSESDMIQMSKK